MCEQISNTKRDIPRPSDEDLREDFFHLSHDLVVDTEANTMCEQFSNTKRDIPRPSHEDLREDFFHDRCSFTAYRWEGWDEETLLNHFGKEVYSHNALPPSLEYMFAVPLLYEHSQKIESSLQKLKISNNSKLKVEPDEVPPPRVASNTLGVKSERYSAHPDPPTLFSADYQPPFTKWQERNAYPVSFGLSEFLRSGTPTESSFRDVFSPWERNQYQNQPCIVHAIQQVKESILDSILDGFWGLMGQNLIFEPAQESPALPLTSRSKSLAKPAIFPKRRTQKRDRSNDDGSEVDLDDSVNGRKVEEASAIPYDLDGGKKLACPYRKHDPQKYRVSEWRTCAATAFPDVSRVKAHLYRKHIVHRCLRCKACFNKSSELETHAEVLEGCDVQADDPVEGVTVNMKERLLSRKKTHRNQTQEDRWREIYSILFPGEAIPSSYFVPVEDNLTRPTEAQGFETYDNYYRREFPKIFRETAEKEIEARILSEVCNMIQNCHDTLSSNYRASMQRAPLPDNGPGGKELASPDASKPTLVDKLHDVSTMTEPPTAAENKPEDPLAVIYFSEKEFADLGLWPAASSEDAFANTFISSASNSSNADSHSVKEGLNYGNKAQSNSAIGESPNSSPCQVAKSSLDGSSFDDLFSWQGISISEGDFDTGSTAEIGSHSTSWDPPNLQID